MRKIFKRFASLLTIFILTIMSIVPVHASENTFFTNCIDRGDIAVVHCGIISSDTGERAGHSMAAEGYATLRAYNSGNTVHTLMVFDGWGDTVRYLNFDFDSWTDISGTTFNG